MIGVFGRQPDSELGIIIAKSMCRIKLRCVSAILRTFLPLPDRIGQRLHIRPHKIKEIAADFKMSVTQHGGVFFPFGMRADDVYRAVAAGFGIVHIAAEGGEGFAHLERVGGVVRNLAECGKGLQFFRAVHADFRAVIKQPVAAPHAVERCGFAVAHLTEPACHAAQDVFLGYGANPIFRHYCLSIGCGFEAACTWVFRKCRLLFGFQAAGILFNHLAAQFVGGVKHHFYAGHGISGKRHIAVLDVVFFFIDNMQIQAHFV